MPATTDRTPQEWAEFCAREVMGAKEIRRHGDHFWQTPDRSWSAGMDWSPWNDPTDALEVLERLADTKQAPFGLTFWRGQQLWIAWIGAISLDQVYIDAMAPGPHFGPAVCELAGKIVRPSSVPSEV